MGASEDLLHIPTPWHNCVVQIKDYNCYYVTKSQIISKALEEGEYVGGWYKADRKGGHFNIARLAQENISKPVNATTLQLQPKNVETSAASEKSPLVYGFFAPPDFKLNHITGILEMINMLKKFHKNISIEMIALDKNSPSHIGLPCFYNLDNCPRLDVFIVPGVRKLNDLTREQLNKVAEICKKADYVFGVETGTLVLAESGVLNRKLARYPSSASSVSKYTNVYWDHSSEWKTDKGYWTTSNPFGTKNAFFVFMENEYPKGDAARVIASLDSTD